MKIQFDIEKYKADVLVDDVQKKWHINLKKAEDFNTLETNAIETYNNIYDDLRAQKIKLEYEIENTPMPRQEYIKLNNDLKNIFKAAQQQANDNYYTIPAKIRDKFSKWIADKYTGGNIKFAQILIEEANKNDYIQEYGYSFAEIRIRELMDFYTKIKHIDKE